MREINTGWYEIWFLSGVERSSHCFARRCRLIGWQARMIAPDVVCLSERIVWLQENVGVLSDGVSWMWARVRRRETSDKVRLVGETKAPASLPSSHATQTVSCWLYNTRSCVASRIVSTQVVERRSQPSTQICHFKAHGFVNLSVCIQITIFW